MNAGVIVVDVPCPTVEKPVARKLRHFRFTVKWLIRKLLVHRTIDLMIQINRSMTIFFFF